MIAATLLGTLALASPPAPAPDPHPSAGAGPIRYEPYTYVTRDRRSGQRMRCYVPVSGRRACVLLERRK